MTTREAINVCRFLLDADDYPNGEQSKIYKYNKEAINMAIDALQWHKTTEEMPTIEGQYLCCVIRRRDGSPYFCVWNWSNDLHEVADWMWNEKIGAGFYGYDAEGYYRVNCDYWKDIRWANEL